MQQPDLQLVDIDLGDGQDFLLNSTNDLSSVSGNTSIIYGLIRRILVQRGTWQSDLTFGSELYSLLSTKGVQEVTNTEISDIIHDAAAPMISDGRISEIIDASIKSRDTSTKTLTLSIIARIGTDVLQVSLTSPQI